MNEPFSWPNSVLSTSSRGIAATLTATNGRSGVRRLAVQQPRQQLLAGAALAEDQHRRRQPRDLVHRLEDVRIAGLGPAMNSRSPASRDLGLQRSTWRFEVLAFAGVRDQRAERSGSTFLVRKW